MKLGWQVLQAALASLLLAPPALAATPKDTLVIGSNLGTFVTLDPAAVNESITANIGRNLCDPLLYLDYEDTSKIVPGLAERWTASDDGKAYTFVIRKGMKFPSGNPVTAHDIAWSMQRTLKLNLANASRMKEWGFATEGADAAFEAKDDQTLVIRAPRAYAPTLFPYAFTDYRVAAALDRVEVMKHEKNGDLGNAWLTTNAACAGAFKLNSMRAQEVMILERTEEYWRGKPSMRRVIIRHVPEPGSQRLLLEKGDIDIAQSIEATDLAALQKNPEVRVINSLDLNTTYLAVNQKDPILSKPQVVEALRYLIDYQGLEDTLMKNLGVVRQSLVPNGVFGALPKDENPYKLDLAKAKELITAAGHPDGFSKTLATQNTYPSPDIAQHIQANAAKIGVKLEVRTMAGSQLFTQMRARDYEIILSGYGFNYPDANNMMLRHAYNPDNSDRAKNTISIAWRTAWNADPWFVQTIDAAQVEKDPARRIALYHELQRRHMREAPLIYLFQRLGNTVTHKNLKDIKDNGVQLFYATAVKG